LEGKLPPPIRVEEE